MHKQEWLGFNDLETLLKQVTSDRKKRLFALAFCRKIEYLMQDQRSKDCLEKLDLFIDGKISKEEFELAKQAADAAKASYYATVASQATRDAAWAVYYSAISNYVAASFVVLDITAKAKAKAADYDYDYDAYAVALADELFKQIELLRDIYNPNLLDIKFSNQAISLAQQVYNGDNTARGVLSDYLEEQGYPAEIVVHLKSGEHPKGCWLIDQILGKS